MYTYSQDPYLSHYGVLGMKWGVRRYQNKDGSLTKAGKKRKSNRDYYINRYENEIKTSLKDENLAKKALKDIEKNGKNSKYVKDLYDHDAEFEEYLVDKVDFWDDETDKQKPFSTLSKKEKKYVLDAAEKKYKSDLEWNNKESRNNYKKIIDNIKSTPLNKMSYAEAKSKSETILAGGAIVGAILPTVAGATLGGVSGGIAGTLFFSPFTTIGGAAIGDSIGNAIYKPSKYIK